MDCVIHFWVYSEVLQATVVKIPQLLDTTTVKYQQIMQFTIETHTIQIQAHRDLDKKLLPMDYKVTYEDLDATVQDWPTE